MYLVNQLTYRLIVFFLLLAPFTVFSQKIDPENLAVAKKFKAEMKDEEVIMTYSESVYEFYADRDQEIKVLQTEDEKYISLRSNATFVKRQYYDDNSSIDSYKLKNEKNRLAMHDQFCGHVKRDEIFYSDAKVCAYHMPFDVMGRAILYQSKKTYQDPRYLTKVFMPKELFTKSRKVVFRIPSWLEVELREINFEGFDIRKNIENTEEGQVITYTMSDVIKLPQEENMPGYLHFVPHLLVLTKSQTLRGIKKNILASTDDLYAWYATLISGVDNDRTRIEEKVNDIITDENLPDKEKIELLYYWVQDNIRYIAFEDGLAGFQPANAQDVLYNRYGDCKGMANLLKNMLLIAGFDARLTWIGTDRIPYDYSIPSLAVDNHMVCSVLAGDSVLVLDATEKFQTILGNGERILGRPILIEDNENYILRKVGEKNAYQSAEINKIRLSIEDGFLTGEGQKEFSGEKMKEVKFFNDAIRNEKKEKFLSYIVSNGKTNEYEIKSISEFERDRPLSVLYSLKLSNKIQTFDKETYIDLDVTKDLYEADIKDDRVAPYDPGRRKNVLTEITLDIPENTTVSSLPGQFVLKNDLLDIAIRYEKEAGQIIYTKSIRILKPFVRDSEFELWNQSIQKLKEFYNNQIILKSNT